MAENKILDDAALDALFSEARDAPLIPSDDLMARIMGDAAAHLPQSGFEAPRSAPRWRLMLAAIGGWGAATGLATATMAGLAFGLFLPDTLSDLTTSYSSAAAVSYDLSDLTPSFYDLLPDES
ncbi:MAG: dihydroorotate dehydrogenase [Paracoccaceae bacterium]